MHPALSAPVGPGHMEVIWRPASPVTLATQALLVPHLRSSAIQSMSAQLEQVWQGGLVLIAAACNGTAQYVVVCLQGCHYLQDTARKPGASSTPAALSPRLDLSQSVACPTRASFVQIQLLCMVFDHQLPQALLCLHCLNLVCCAYFAWVTYCSGVRSLSCRAPTLCPGCVYSGVHVQAWLRLANR